MVKIVSYQEETGITWQEGFEVEALFRSCDNPDDLKKFKSLELTWYWCDETIEIAEEVKLMLRNRIGRYPTKCPHRYGIETTNPPDVEHPMYSEFKWVEPPPGPIPAGEPLKNHVGFWQKPGENELNLRPDFYRDLRNDYANYPEWIATYIDGKPGIIIHGRLVYQNFERAYHVAKELIVWPGPHCELWRGWDHSGNTPACIVIQMPTLHRIQVLKEFVTEKLGIIDFAKLVNTTCNQLFPGATYHDWGDPAGSAEFSKKEGGFTSNTKLIQEATGIEIQTSEQN